MLRLNSMSKEPARGVFWVIDGKVVSYPFYGDSVGRSKSGTTYNHKLLWKELGLSKKPYNYYPRGRVDFTNKGKPIIYINPNVDSYDLQNVKSDFGLREEPIVRFDYSSHYKCYLDEGWEPD